MRLGELTLQPALQGPALQQGEDRVSLEVNGCCLAAPIAHLKAWGHNCLIHHPQLRPRLQETNEGHKPGACGVWVFSLWVLSACPTADVEASRISGVALPHSTSDLKGGWLAALSSRL